MPTSIFIAKLLGPLVVVLSIALSLKPQMFRDIFKDFLASAALVYLAGFLGLLGGLALVLTHNVWVGDWRLIITLLGWIAIARALITIFQPQWVVALASRVFENRRVLFVAAALNLVMGLVLSYFGYFA